MPPRTGARRRLGSIRLSLILLALIPSVTLAAMWGVTTIQMFSEGLRLREQTGLSRSTGAMGTDATLALQRERSLSAAWLAGSDGARDALDAQRGRTDAAIAKLVGRSDAIDDAPSRIGDRLYSVIAAADSLEYYREQVDDPTDITAQQALDHYTSIIDEQIHAFQELSQVDDGDLTSQAQPLIAAEQAAELVSQEDALLTLAWPSGRLDEESRTRFENLVGARRWLVTNQLVPSLQGSVKTRTERILQSSEWKIMEALEEQVLAGRTTGVGVDRRTVLPDTRERWRATMDTLIAQYRELIQAETEGLLERSADEARGLIVKAASLSAGGLVAMLLCAVMSWRITRSLSLRLRGLRMATLRLAQERLPDVVARLNRGETVDVESATPPLDYGRDELGQVAEAFNTAQRTAVHTAVELADTRRGFQKVILGIARQSQNLVNLQLSKLDALERRHQDPHVLEGLYELDSTASQLRRYEENLVIISGERPGRTWSRPVALIDILRSAVGEVAQYQRVEVHTEEEVYVAPPAVADVIHLLAELIDNATAYSPAPSPVTVRAAMVAKGLAVEIDDRGLGLSDEDYAAFNAQLAEAPQFDVVALADDLRLGMFVIARLATRHGITVTLRPSPYGGTTAIVLVPHDIVVRELTDADGPAEDTGDMEEAVPAFARLATAPPAHEAVAHARGSATGAAGDAEGTWEHAAEPDAAGHVRADDAGHVRTGGTATAAASRSAAPRLSPAAGAGTARAGGRGRGEAAPLPRRIPQTSLAAELREDVRPSRHDDSPGSLDHSDSPDSPGLPDPADDFTAERAASSLAGFQRGTLLARDESAETESAGTENLEPREPHAPHEPLRPLMKDREET
ncbi:sensor histidine kinase [Streptomyces poonensis]|uniref:histidine kinase n=1 Tax=Streptomyces poonensis TaxID=68255 RepID=A0A918PZY2_9ACTN|nr:nitrate- and nitrite sensing domain-containing protein [Streptomyces poonensis]GGZ27957.1 histidine kinase [Streptomyces poonensis]GLJ89765.1 histidine kinase [Streptomyces poonensis]